MEENDRKKAGKGGTIEGRKEGRNERKKIGDSNKGRVEE